MSWDAIGAVGEVLGALAVVFSLIYLASQIRTNNKAIKQSMAQEQTRGLDAIIALLAPNPELVDIWNRGNADPESLNATELTQYNLVLMHNITYWQSIFLALDKDAAEYEWLEKNARRTRLLGWSQLGYRRHISENSSLYADEFLKVAQEEIESSLKEQGPPRGILR